MSIISFFNKVLTGQQSKARTIDGLEVSYRYSGKPVLFDPITMLRELKYKLENGPAIPGELCVKLSEIVDPTLILREQLLPSVVAKFKLGEDSVEVKRCVKTFETVPCSKYDFFLNQSPLCTFQRMYDYGKSFDGSREKIFPYTNNEDISMTNFWKNDKNEGLFLEHFGHTQLWIVHSVSDLESVWKKLGN